MDWRRRSSRSGGRASEDGADEVRRAFHTIDMAASTTSTTRRSSRSLSHGAARAESWMARVSTAMSHRIFSGHSRSTQVMPLVSSQAGHGSVDMGAPLAASTSEDSFLTATKPLQHTEVVTLHDCEDANVNGVVASVDQADVNCPSVAFDVQDSSDESEVERQRVRNVRSQTQSERVPKVAPTRGVAAFDDVDEDDPQPASRIRSSTTFVHSVDAVREASTPGVLQDFFRRPPTAAAELREQQRRARREAHYRRIRERQERLRVRVGSEDAMDAALDADRRRVRAQQLRRLSVARRLEFKREAAAAKELVVARVAAQDARALEEAKQTWERDFADEMRELSDAFHAKAMRLHADVVRPTTVAGLAVPEAAVEIQRSAVSASRRVQTAGDVSPRRLNSQDFHGPVENSVEAMEVLEGADSEEEEGIDLLEADEDEDEEEDVDLAMDLDTLGAEMEGVAVDVDALLREREQLLRRLADIERLVAVRQTLGGA